MQGHGICDNHSRSVTLSRFVGSKAELAKAGKELLKAMNVAAPEIRGLGLSVSNSCWAKDSHVLAILSCMRSQGLGDEKVNHDEHRPS